MRGAQERSMTATAAVTAVVVAHNSARHLQELADALASGSTVPERMLVVDNASTDDTVARARQAGFEVYENETNDGFGAACNIALGMTTSEFVLICNPDIRPTYDALEQMLAALAQAPRAAVVGPVFNRRLRVRRFSRISGNLFSFLPPPAQRPLKRFDCEVPVGRDDGNVVVDYVVGACMLCRAEALREVGGFDESFFLYSEEEDLCRRLRARGWLTLFVASVTVMHGRRASSDGVDRAVMAPFRFHSLYWYYRKHHSRPYAELARCALWACLTFDRRYRALTRREPVFGASATRALFWSTDEVRGDYERAIASSSSAGALDERDAAFSSRGPVSRH
jgi:N-acetylglucosaminyl-diphospho-decaprenol L-rhamnosyltransferase